MILNTNTLLLAAILVVATCAVVVAVLAVWDMARDWWHAGARSRAARRRDRGGMLL